ncbi:MAG TPA: hypothetical protein H9903_06900 [Candidatus Aquabacterium excrementipullorum]|nr:hypothetical protein [Candidatus Aquabacterium excrementipullorum]
MLTMVGCASNKAVDADGKPTAPEAITTLEEHLAQATRAEEAGDREKARGLYRAAAKAYPVAEEPWQKLAESYFNAGDYGNAIQAAQEVMQRDPKDATAASVLAISGLRLSSQAFAVLHEQAEGVRAKSGGAAKPLTNASILLAARMEAETLARNLRELLGEPPAGKEPAPAQPNRARARPAVRPAVAASGVPAAGVTAPVQPAVRPATPAANAARPAATGGSPFDKLK